MVASDFRKLFTQKYEVQIDNLKIEYISEWRKGVTIGYSKDNISSYKYIPNIINKNNKILYHGYGCYDYVEEIYRTSKGYYLVYHYKDFSAPGKDPDYRGPFLKCVISENGEEIIYQSDIDKYLYKSLDFKSDWYNPYDNDVFIPKEMGLGIVEYDNSFYQLDDYKKLFEIPHKFKIESIFEQNQCLLSVPDDNRDIIVTVKNAEAVDFVEVNDVDKMINLIDRTNDASLIKFSTNINSTIVKVLKKQVEIIEGKREEEKCKLLEKVNYYSDYKYPRHYISDKSITLDEFEKDITLDNDEVKVIKELYQTVCQEGEREGREKYLFHLREIDSMPDDCLECLFFKNFMILRMPDGHHQSYYRYRFFSLDGKCLSEKSYDKILSTKDHVSVEEDKTFSHNCFHYFNDRKDSGIIIIKDGKLIENKFPDFMFDENNVSVNEHCIIYNGDRYNFNFNKIPINYIDVEIEEVIRNYLYKMKPEFEYYHIANHYIAPYELLNDGKLYLPTSESLESVDKKLSHKLKVRPNHVESIIHIGDYEDSHEDYSLYLFKCRPHAYCDTKGQISYDFNPDKIEL